MSTTDRPPDALELHEIGRLVLGAGIGPRWDLAKLGHRNSDGVVEVSVRDREGWGWVTVDLWNDRGPSVGGAREVAERFIDELERAGFAIVRRTL